MNIYFSDGDYWRLRNGLELATATAESSPVLQEDAKTYRALLKRIEQEYENSGD